MPCPTYKSLLETSNKERRELSKEEAKIFITLTTEEENINKEIIKDNFSFSNEKLPLATRIIISRIENSALQISPSLILFCTQLSENPGQAVLWAHAISLLAQENDGHAGMKNFTNAFPFGVPNDESISRCWDSQKIKGGNWLDTAEAWEIKENNKIVKP